MLCSLECVVRVCVSVCVCVCVCLDVCTDDKQGTAAPIHATIPYIRNDIPIMIIFRALGVNSDREILELICYDFKDRG